MNKNPDDDIYNVIPADDAPISDQFVAKEKARAITEARAPSKKATDWAFQAIGSARAGK